MDDRRYTQADLEQIIRAREAFNNRRNDDDDDDSGIGGLLGALAILGLVGAGGYGLYKGYQHVRNKVIDNQVNQGTRQAAIRRRQHAQSMLPFGIAGFIYNRSGMEAADDRLHAWYAEEYKKILKGESKLSPEHQNDVRKWFESGDPNKDIRENQENRSNWEVLQEAFDPAKGVVGRPVADAYNNLTNDVKKAWGNRRAVADKTWKSIKGLF